MSMIFLRCLILSEFVTISYTAPKLGHILFDPLNYEAAMFIKKDVSPSTSNDAIHRFLRMQDKPDKTTKKPSLGYDYDEELCKLLGDRIVCGYNKNFGQPTDAQAIIDIGNGCFIRGDRVECGYVNKRLPINSLNQPEEGSPVKHKKPITSSTTLKTSEAITTTVATEVTERLTSKPPTSTSDPKTITVPTATTVETSKATTTLPTEKTKTEKSEQIKTTMKSRFKCVDKNNSLFCYELNEVK